MRWSLDATLRWMGRVAFGTAVLVAGVAPAAAKSSVAVLEFENKSTSGGNYWNYFQGYDLGWGMSEMLTTELVKTGRFRVVERQKIEDVLKEQDFGQSGRVAAGTEAKLGNVLGARFLVYGAVTELNVQEKGAGAKINIGGVGLGGAAAIGTVTIDLRVVDSTSGEIVDSYTAHGKAKSAKLDASYSGADVSTAGDAFWQSGLGKATREAIQDAVDQLVKSIPEAPDMALGPAWTGGIEVADDGSLVVLGGSKNGLKSGAVLQVVRSKTKKVGGKEMVVGTEIVGSVQLTSVGEEASEAVSAGGEKPRKGDQVTTKAP
jgi:curli biogenesis system outer membrane secretion channel CsgG